MNLYSHNKVTFLSENKKKLSFSNLNALHDFLAFSQKTHLWHKVSGVILERRQPTTSPGAAKGPAAMITAHLFMRNGNDIHLNSNKREGNSHLIHVNYVLLRGEYFPDKASSSKLQLCVCCYKGHAAHCSTPQIPHG